MTQRNRIDLENVFIIGPSFFIGGTRCLHTCRSLLIQDRVVTVLWKDKNILFPKTNRLDISHLAIDTDTRQGWVNNLKASRSIIEGKVSVGCVYAAELRKKIEEIPGSQQVRIPVSIYIHKGYCLQG